MRDALTSLIFASMVACHIPAGDARDMTSPDLIEHPTDLRPPLDLGPVLDLSSVWDLNTILSKCGHPGDKGNSLGVGKFCSEEVDCAGNSKATLCSTLGNDPMHPENNTYFCTFLCSKASPPDFCGENALCSCNGASCGCIPTVCAGSGDGGI